MRKYLIPICKPKKATLDFTLGLVLAALTIGAIAVIIVSMCSRDIEKKPILKMNELITRINNVAQEQEGTPGASQTFLGYIGDDYGIIGFSSTADTIKLMRIERKENSQKAKNLNVVIAAERPKECKKGKPCLCLIKDPEANQAYNDKTITTLTASSLGWEKSECYQDELVINDFFNFNPGETTTAKRDFSEVTYETFMKGGFMILRYDTISAPGQIKYFLRDEMKIPNLPGDIEIKIEKSGLGIGICAQNPKLQQDAGPEPCVTDEMEKQQKLFTGSSKKFSAAQGLYQKEEYAEAEPLFAELIAAEDLQEEKPEKRWPGALSIKEAEPGSGEYYPAENILNKKEFNDLLMSNMRNFEKQNKFPEVVESARIAEKYATEEQTQAFAESHAENYNCTKRSFALCTETKPKDACYRLVYPENFCSQCTSQTGCWDIDNKEACEAFPCSLACRWQGGLCISSGDALDTSEAVSIFSTSQPGISVQTINSIWAQYNPILVQASQETGIAPELIIGIIMAETRGNPNLISTTGAAGIGQFTHTTRYITKTAGCCKKEEGEEYPHLCVNERKRCGSAEWCEAGNYGCSPDPLNENYDERFDAQKSILSIAESQLLANMKLFLPYGLDSTTTNALVVLSYNAGGWVGERALQKTIEETGNEKPGWLEIQKYITPELLKEHKTYSTWPEEALASKCRDVKSYVPKVLSYAEKANEIIANPIASVQESVLPE